eukprot:gene3441-6834_t
MKTRRGTNSQGNKYSTPGGSNSASSTSYHYSNADGSYYYKNDNGSTYYNRCDGSKPLYKPSPSSPETNSGRSNKKRTIIVLVGDDIDVGLIIVAMRRKNKLPVEAHLYLRNRLTSVKISAESVINGYYRYLISIQGLLLLLSAFIQHPRDLFNNNGRSPHSFNEKPSVAKTFLPSMGKQVLSDISQSKSLHYVFSSEMFNPIKGGGLV